MTVKLKEDLPGLQFLLSKDISCLLHRGSFVSQFLIGHELPQL